MAGDPCARCTPARSSVARATHGSVADSPGAPVPRLPPPEPPGPPTPPVEVLLAVAEPPLLALAMAVALADPGGPGGPVGPPPVTDAAGDTTPEEPPAHGRHMLRSPLCISTHGCRQGGVLTLGPMVVLHACAQTICFCQFREGRCGCGAHYKKVRSAEHACSFHLTGRRQPDAVPYAMWHAAPCNETHSQAAQSRMQSQPSKRMQ